MKNLLELKNARRVVVEYNVMENNWSDAQALATELGSTTQFPDAPFELTGPAAGSLVEKEESVAQLLERDGRVIRGFDAQASHSSGAISSRGCASACRGISYRGS